MNSGTQRSASRLAVVGLYNSGSTTVAGMLHRLGVNMGPPFWKTSGEDAEENYYEPYDLAWHLRHWWDEPRMAERTPAALRIGILRQWVRLQECISGSPVGAKHPLLSLCCNDLMTAWSTALRLIWVWRPLAASIAGLQRRRWFSGHESPLQHCLWRSLEQFEAEHPGLLHRVDWESVLANPKQAAEQLARLAEISPTPQQLTEATRYVRQPLPGRSRT